MHGPLEVLQRQLHQRGALHTVLRHGDRVQRNVKAARLPHDLPGVGLDGFLVQGVHHRGLRQATGFRDLLGQRVKRFAVAPGEEHPSSVTGEPPRDRGTDRTGGAVDDGILVLQQHVAFPPNTLPGRAVGPRDVDPGGEPDSPRGHTASGGDGEGDRSISA